jgi:hypothetical protein
VFRTERLDHHLTGGTVIADKSFTKEWIQAKRSAYQGADPGLIEKQQGELNSKTTDLIDQLLKDQPKGQSDTPGRIPIPFKKVTGEQEGRGRKGEEEIKRRLQQLGGLNGIVLVEDRRSLDCGYDFLGRLEDLDVELEVKTFAPNGRMIFAGSEIREAAAARQGYYLIAVVDNGGPVNTWEVGILQDPIAVLLAMGRFDIDAKLAVDAGGLLSRIERK